MNLGFLFMDDAEVVNSARTGEYVRRGLGPGGLVVGDCLCSVLERESGVPSGGFVSPAVDPAPWYNSGLSESGEFLGILIDSIDGLDDAPVSRSVQQQQSGGGSLGRSVTTPRTVVFHGWLVATSDCGLEYGRQWLTSRLGGCSDCGTVQARVRTCCPPDNGSDDERGNYRLNGVGLTAGPAMTGVTLGPDCPIAEIEFTLTSERAELVGAVVPCLTETVLNPDLEPDGVVQWFDVLFNDFTVPYVVDAGVAPVLATGRMLSPTTTATHRWDRRDRAVRFGRNTWLVDPVTAGAGFTFEVFIAGDIGGAHSYLAAQLDSTGFRLVKVVAAAYTTLATAGGAAGGASTVMQSVTVGIHDRRVWAEWRNEATGVVLGFCVVELSQADAAAFDVAGRRATGMLATVENTGERYGPNTIDTSMDFDTWWAGQKPAARCCTVAAQPAGSIAGLVTLEAGLEQDMHGAVVHAYAPTGLKTSTTLQTTTSLETSTGTLLSRAEVRDLPAGSTLLLDGTLRRGVATTGGVSAEGSQYLGLPTIDAPNTWPAVAACGSAGEVCAYSDGYGGSGDDATVTIQQQAATL